MVTFWHFEQLASGKPEWPRRMNPAVFDDARADAGGFPAVVDGLSDHITRRVREAALVGASIGFVWWNPGGVTPRPTPDNPGHVDYPDHCWAAARNHVEPNGDARPMRKAGNTAAFVSACRRLVQLGVRSIMVYQGRMGQWDGGAGACNAVDPELADMLAKGVVSHVAWDGTAHMPPLPIRERAMAQVESAGGVACYEAVPDLDGPGSDLGRNPARVCVSYLDEWDVVQERETSQPYQPTRNRPAAHLRRVLLLDRRDDPTACAAHVAAGREVAINFAAAAWQRVNLMDLWSGATVARAS